MVRKILLVDDDEEEFYILKLALEMTQGHFKCFWANDLEQATQMLKDLQPEFVFIDINMPRNDGISCLKKFKQLKPLNHTAFVMYSTYISAADHKEAIQLGASHCMQKADNIHVLLNQLMSLLNNKTHSS